MIKPTLQNVLHSGRVTKFQITLTFAAYLLRVFKPNRLLLSLLLRHNKYSITRPFVSHYEKTLTCTLPRHAFRQMHELRLCSECIVLQWSHTVSDYVNGCCLLTY
jgi:hypothetical protein